jgi:hypothetical protein
MKIAISISGQARFSPDFDSFLEKMSTYKNVDWYFHFWKPDHYTHTEWPCTKILPTSWMNPDYDWAHNKLKNYIPQHHNLKYLGFSNPTEVSIPIFHKEKHARPKNISAMYLGWKKLMDIISLSDYDLVIVSRLDAGIAGDFKLEDMDLNVVTACSNEWHGVEVESCDIINIGGAKIMNSFCKISDNLQNLIDLDYTFHPETILGAHLKELSIKQIKGSFERTLRSLPNNDLDTDPRWN